MLILDTDLLSFLEYASANAQAKALMDRLEEKRKQERVVTSIVCYEEKMRGWMSSLSKKDTVKGLVTDYRRLRVQLDNFREMEVVDFDEAAAVRFQALKKSKLRVGTMDLRISAIALVHDATVVTGNLGDFQRVPGLKVLHWDKL